MLVILLVTMHGLSKVITHVGLREIFIGTENTDNVTPHSLELQLGILKVIMRETLIGIDPIQT